MKIAGAAGRASAFVLVLAAAAASQAHAADRVQYSAASQSVGESAGQATLTVQRTGTGAGAATVRYSVRSGNADVGTDYAPVAGVLAWADGDTAAKTFNVTIVGDGNREPREWLRLQLESPTGAALGTQRMTTLYIDDDDWSGANGGVIGVAGQFMANMQNAITALLSGDYAGAQGAVAAASGDFVAGISALPTDSAGHLLGTGAEPNTIVARASSANRSVEPVVLTGAQLPGWSQPAARGASQDHFAGFENFTGATQPGHGPRNAHAGIMAYPPNWAAGDAPMNAGGADVHTIAAYARDNNRWREIRVQVDERYPYFLANGNSTFSFYSGIDQELNYAWDTESWGMTKGTCSKEYDPNGVDVVRPGFSSTGYYTPFVPDGDPNQGVSKAIPDPIAGLDDDDEVAFMASDAGDLYVGTTYPASWKAVQVVKLEDPLDAAATRYVYLVQKTGGSSFSAASGYVSYVRDGNADQWIDRYFYASGDPEQLGSSNTNYGANLSGTVCLPGGGTRNSTDRFPRDGVAVTTSTYRWYASGRWMVRDLRVKQPGVTVPAASYWTGRPDLIDRWKGRAFQQSPDSQVSVVGFEDEQVNWEANSSLLGERCGAVRCMREIWGADSGTNVTNTETYYRDAITYHYHVRVHPIPPDGLYTSWDYNRSAMVPSPGETVQGGRYFTALRPAGVPIDGVNDDVGNVDGIAGQPAYFDGPDPTFNLLAGFENWEQVSGKGDTGSLVYIFEMTGPTSAANPLVVPYYRDDACLDDGTGDDPWDPLESTCRHASLSIL